MIIFHEGMPRQGKSYESMKAHIIPGLSKRRKVYARLDGADDSECRAKVAELAGLTKDELDELYIHLTPEQVRKIWTLDLDKDALICIDELQNYWPQQRQPLPEELRKWIAEHGHHGWDILTMGQVLSECHKTWVNRTNRKVQFQKKDVLGKPNEYQWRMYLGKPDQNGIVKFTEISKGGGEYEEKYFGTYKSHSEGTENTETYEDSRVVIWNHPMFKKWLPMFAIFLLLAIGYLVYFFSGGAVAPPQPKPVSVKETITTSGPGQETKTITRDLMSSETVETVKAVATKVADFEIPDLITETSKDNKIRLAYLIRSAKALRVGIEWRDGGKRIVEALDLPDIEALGWRVMASPTDKMVWLIKGDKRLVATSWPIEETLGKVPQQHKDEIAAPARQESKTPIKVASTSE